VKKLRCKPFRQKDPMNLNGGGLRQLKCLVLKRQRSNIYDKVSKLGLSTRKIKRKELWGGV